MKIDLKADLSASTGCPDPSKSDTRISAAAAMAPVTPSIDPHKVPRTLQAATSAGPRYLRENQELRLRSKIEGPRIVLWTYPAKKVSISHSPYVNR